MKPRNEVHNPQFERKNAICLNGEWEFAVDMEKIGRDDGIELFKPDAKGFDRRITLPFCPESELSGIGEKGFMYSVWYRREIDVSDSAKGKRVILKIGACDYKTTVWVNGEEVGTHLGGYSSFSFDITDKLTNGKGTIVINAEDDCRKGTQPSGKQSPRAKSFGCLYTRTTGIWQTVSIELVPEKHIDNFRIVTDIHSKRAIITGKTTGCGKISANAFYNGEIAASDTSESSGSFALVLNISELHLWELGKGELYDLELSFGEDTVKSYFGMREVKIEDGKFLLNGKTVFQRLVLDQGFYPDGIYTAPSDDAIVNDIKISMAAGFNGARLHEKVFEPRFLYHCDRLGYMVWGEQGNWGYNPSRPENLHNYAEEWTEVVERDANHPSIVCWCPFNETNPQDSDKWNHDITVKSIYKLTKTLDPTRPCIDVSGFCHTGGTDIFDVHDYTHDTEIMKNRYLPYVTPWSDDEILLFGGKQKYSGTPVHVSEYGGIGLSLGNDGWGYNKSAASEEEFIKVYRDITNILLDCPNILGFCYTQLYDVEQEQNGIYTYEREPKVNIKKIREINTRTAAVEKLRKKLFGH